MATLTLHHLEKKYDDQTTAIENFDLNIADGEFIVLVGPSGCGKSTLLRMIAGLEQITSGELYIDNQLMNDVDPKDRELAMVFQNYALYPHLNVYDNMAFSLKLRRLDKQTIDERVRDVAHILGLENYLERRPSQLSGGQRQRVALGRAIVREPKVFLMDEPLSNLDAKLRVQMRYEISKLHQKLQATMIYVTHDQTEAMTMGDRVVVMNEGCIQQVGTPDEIYQEPQNLFVATFLGSPKINLLACDVIDGKVELFTSSLNAVNDKHLNLIAGIRPEHLALKAGDNYRVTLIENLGNHKNVYLESDDAQVSVQVDSGENYYIGERYDIVLTDPSKVLFFDREQGNRIM